MEIYRDGAAITPPRQRGYAADDAAIDSRRRKVLTPKDTNRRFRRDRDEDGESKAVTKSSLAATARTGTVRDGGTTSVRTSGIVKPKLFSPRTKKVEEKVAAAAAVDGPAGSSVGTTSKEETSDSQIDRSTVVKRIQFGDTTETKNDGTRATKRRTSILRSTKDPGSKLRSSLRKPAVRVTLPASKEKDKKAVSTLAISADKPTDRKDSSSGVTVTKAETLDGNVAQTKTEGTDAQTKEKAKVRGIVQSERQTEVDGGRVAPATAPSGLRGFIEERRTLIKQNDIQSITGGQSISRGGGILMDLSNAFSEDTSPVAKRPTSGTSRRRDVKKEATTEKAAVESKPLPVVSLGNFQESLWLDFGNESRNVVGKTRSLSFLLEAPQFSSPSGYHSVEFERVPFKKGFNLIVEDDTTQQRTDGTAPGSSHMANSGTPSRRIVIVADADDVASEAHSSPTVLCIKNGDRKRLRLTWTPTEAGGVRETVHLKLARGRIQITAHGKARTLVKGKKGAKASSTARPQIPTTPYSGASVAESNQINAVSLATPGHAVNKKRSKKVSSGGLATPAPNFATPKTVYAKSSPAGSVTSASKARARITYDNEWADKQCDAFAKWLNYTFQPTEDLAHERSLQDMQEGVDGAALDRVGLRTLLLHRRRAQGRQKATELYQTDGMKAMQHAIETEVNGGRLAIRSDRNVFADVALRKQMISLLLSYSTPWLRLGLETIFGEIISSDITHRPAQNKATAASGGELKPAVVRPKTLLKRFIVDRVLADPVLAKKYTGGRCKVLSGRFEKQYKAELRKHSLRRILLLVAFLDKAKRENILDNVPCLFTRNGIVKSSKDVFVMICRDYLSMESNIIKHLSKIGITVSYKQEPIDEFDYTIQNLAVDLRDGVRLSRMVEILTNDTEATLLENMRLPAVSRLQKLHNVGIALSALSDAGVPNLTDIATHHVVDGHRPQVLKLLWSTIAHFKLASMLDVELLREEIRNVHRANKSRRVSLSFDRDARPDTSTSAALFDGIEGELGILLLQWCQAVCSCFGFHVANFSSSFASGKALCLLLHYYHPGLLRKAEILPSTRDLPKSALSQKSDGRYAEALKNERLNSSLANKRMLELGGVPGMLPVTDSHSIPEEKSTILCVAYLCSRLMESSKEILATIAIQNCYRRYQDRILRLKKEIAALVIFKVWTENKESYFAAQRSKYGTAVGVLETFISANKLKFKMIRAKRMVEERSTASACLIQSIARRMLAVISFQVNLTQFRAAMTIQTFVRAHHKQLSYRSMQYSSVIIQSIYRGYRARCKVKAFHSSATIIQSLWRGFVAAFQFQCDLMDVTRVQCCARRRVAVVDARKRRTSLLLIQCAARRYMACRRRTAFQEVKIQAEHLVAVATLCQSLARQVMAVKRFRPRLARFRAAIIIQSNYRRYRSSKTTTLLHSGATTIQTAWRSFWSELQYGYTLMDIICTQSCARRLIALSETKKRRTSVLQIQHVARMWLSLQRLHALQEDRNHAEQLDAATVLCQSLSRRRAAQKKFQFKLACSRAAVKVQASYRAQRQRLVHSNMLVAATRIQRCQRGYRSRCLSALLRSCATIIQAAWRVFRAELKYECALMDIIYAQSCARRLLAIKEANCRRSSGLKLQCAVRRWISLRRLCALQNKKFEADRFVAAAIVCQSITRQRKATKLVAAKKEALRAATAVQTFFRAHQQHTRYASMKQSVALVQSCYRGHRVRCNVESLSVSATSIQTLFRAYQQQSQYCGIKQFTVLIQASYRGFQARKEIDNLNSSAVTIQRVWRGVSAELRYHYARMSVICIQSTVRGLLALKQSKRRMSLVATVQCVARKWLACRRLASLQMSREEEEARRLCVASCVEIQRIVRGMQARTLCLKHMAARQIQKTWRGYIDNVDFMVSILSAITIQARVRRRICQERYQMAREGFTALQAVSRGASVRASAQEEAIMAVRLQSWYRSAHTASSFRRHQQASVLIQSAARSMFARRDIDLQHFAALEIQRSWRGYHANVDYIMILLAAIKIQSVFRQAAARQLVSTLKGDTLLEEVERRCHKCMARKILHAFRMMIRRQATKAIMAVRLQSWYRSAHTASSFRRHQQASVLIQSAARGMFARRDIDLQHFAALEIQRSWRGYHANVDYIMILLATIKIQSVFRQAAARQLVLRFKGDTLLEEVERRYHQCMARKIQDAFRMMIRRRVMTQRAITLQRVGRGFLARRYAAKITRAVLFAQSAYRARSVRLTRSRKVRTAAKRILRANKKAESEPQMKLGVRTSGALDVLLASNRLSEVIRAIKTLEVSTRLSQKCCKAFATAKAPEILYALIRTCNRSLPHVELLNFVLLTLVNVARHPALLTSVATDDSIEVLMDLIQMFRDKEKIFCLSVSLLERIVYSGNVYLEQCRTQENIKRLSSILTLCKRRQKLTKDSSSQRKTLGTAHHDMRHGIRLLEKVLFALQ